MTPLIAIIIGDRPELSGTTTTYKYRPTRAPHHLAGVFDAVSINFDAETRWQVNQVKLDIRNNIP